MLLFLTIWSAVGCFLAILIQGEMAHVEKVIVHIIMIALCGPIIWVIFAILFLIMWGQKKN